LQAGRTTGKLGAGGGASLVASATYGAFAEEMVADAERVMKIPNDLDFVTASD